MEKRRKALPRIVGANADRTGRGKLNFEIILTAQDYGKNFFSKDNMLKSSGQVVFSEQEESLRNHDHHSSENTSPEFLSDIQNSDTFSQDPIPFFPQVIFF